MQATPQTKENANGSRSQFEFLATLHKIRKSHGGKICYKYKQREILIGNHIIMASWNKLTKV